MEELNPESNATAEENYYLAGFWWRLPAYIIDTVIISFCNALALHPLLGSLGVTFPKYSPFEIMERQKENPLLSPFELLGVTATDFFIIQLFSVAVFWLYFAVWESSRSQATPGKMIFGLVVTDTEGDPISFWRATGRTLGKYLSALIFLIGFIMAAFTEKKQALHDLIAGCLVLKKER